ncbi:MAG TPA: ATP-dependent DNA helicase RecG [bacterium]|nr:ATP-dependent DNA helicase RecG [bacterium]
MLTYSSPLNQLNKVGPKTLNALHKLDLKTILDLVFYFPNRYERYETASNLNNLKINQAVIVSGQIDLIRNKKTFKKRMYITEALISNDSGSLEIIWFNQPFITKTLKIGDSISLAGKITLSNGRLLMVSPTYEKIIENKKMIHTASLVPIYNLSSGLTQKQLRYFIHQALEIIKEIPEYLPPEIIKKYQLLDIKSALNKIHFPNTNLDLDQAIDRFKFSELFIFRLKSYFVRHELDKKLALPLGIKLSTIKKFISSLPFKLTSDQKKAAWSILRDCEKPIPMSRLLQGDVGSGKTIVAMIAIFNCVKNKKQAVIMAPTEILAQQHYNSFCFFFKDNNFKIALLTSKKQLTNFPLSTSKKDQSLEITKQADIIIGTHALIQDKIKFKKLALVVIDEQHRFGVNQREEIISKNIDDNNNRTTPHFLSMTATPIPRSLALMSFFGLDFSIISEKPKDRIDIKTKIILPEEKESTYNFIKQEIKHGHQAFIVCPLIDPSDKFEAKSVKAEYQRLKNNEFKDIEIAMLHGKMSSSEKEDIMNNFSNNKIKVLVSTSVLELGIDIKNATTILIEGAERFGLAQLHQFRGRVGRSNLASYCFLSLSEAPPEATLLNKKINYSSSIERLTNLQKYQDGLSLAKMDLEARGSGDFYGTAQSGIMNFKFATLFDHDTITKVDEAINSIASYDPDFTNHPKLIKKIKSSLDQAHLE